MQSRIAITRKWSDADVALLEFEVCDGMSVFRVDAYVSLDWGVATATQLRTFGRQIYGGLLNLDVGESGPEYAAGAFRARFHFFSPSALLISTTQQGTYFAFKNGEVAPEAKMFLRTEPALLDRFIEALPNLDTFDEGEAVLECVNLNGA